MIFRYYFNCGHRENYATRYGLCPVCKNGRIMAKQFWCENCGESIGFFQPRSLKRFCDTCIAERQRRQNRYYKRKRSGNLHLEKTPVAIVRKSDCLFYNEKCLPEAAFKNTEFTCAGCERYIPVDIEVMYQGTLGDSFAMTRIPSHTRERV